MKREPSRETLSRPGKPRWPAARSAPRQPTVAAASAAIACLIFVTVRRQLDCAQPEKRADPAAGTPWPRPHPARSAVLPGLTWSNRGLAHRKADTTEQPDLKRPRTQPGAGRRRTDQADIACRRLAELSRSVTRCHRPIWQARCRTGQTRQRSPGLCDAQQRYDAVIGTRPPNAPGRARLPLVTRFFLARPRWVQPG